MSDLEPIRPVLPEAYPYVRLGWDPASVGHVFDCVGAIPRSDLQAARLAALADLLPVGPPPGPFEGDLLVPLLDCWQAGP